MPICVSAMNGFQKRSKISHGLKNFQIVLAILNLTKKVNQRNQKIGLRLMTQPTKTIIPAPDIAFDPQKWDNLLSSVVMTQKESLLRGEAVQGHPTKQLQVV